MSAIVRLTSADLEAMPEDGNRYELIDGVLYVSRQPNWYHQVTCYNTNRLLQDWSNRTGRGSATGSPGVIFGEHDDVAPDIVWISHQRLAVGLDPAGHLRVPPELVVEVVSTGVENERRDREAKLALYSRRGVDEYWIPDWRTRTVTVYRRRGDVLAFIATLTEKDILTSPLLPGFEHPISDFFFNLHIVPVEK